MFQHFTAINYNRSLVAVAHRLWIHKVLRKGIKRQELIEYSEPS